MELNLEKMSLDELAELNRKNNDDKSSGKYDANLFYDIRRTVKYNMPKLVSEWEKSHRGGEQAEKDMKSLLHGMDIWNAPKHKQLAELANKVMNQLDVESKTNSASEQKVPPLIARRKETLKQGNFEFAVKPGAFGMDNVSKVSIGIPFEYSGLSPENAPTEIRFQNGDKNIVSCLLETNGSRMVSLYNPDGKSLAGRYILSGDKIYQWHMNGKAEAISGYNPLAEKAKEVSQISEHVWHNYIKGSYDKQSVVNRAAANSGRK